MTTRTQLVFASTCLGALLLVVLCIALTQPGAVFGTAPSPYRSTFFDDLDTCRHRAGFHPEQRDLYREELQSFERQRRYNQCMDASNHPNQWLH